MPSHRTFILMLALVAPAVLAGCTTNVATPAATGEGIDALLSQPLLETLIQEHMPVESFDGAMMDAWVFRPETEDPVPVIINFSPYWHNLAPPAETGGDAFSLYLIDHFVPRGYAVALVSARGTGLSDGCFTIGGPMEIADEDVVATFFGTQPWSNGNVTATGKSYDGTMAQSLITTGNPHVRTIVPVSAISELYKYNYHGGVPYGNGLVTNTFNTDYVLGVSLTQDASTYQPGVPNPTNPTYEKLATRFCDESVDVQTSQYHSLMTGDYTPYWQARNYTALLPDALDTSVLYIHGLQDWNVKPDHMVPWIEALHARGVPVKMMLGQWAHDYPHRDDFNLTLLRWLDHHLKGIDTGIMQEPMAQVQDTDGIWRDEADWPVTRATPRVLYTSADGTLGDAAGAGDSRYADNAAPLDALLGGAVFETTVEDGFRIVGSPVFNAIVSATGPRATLSVILSLDGEIVDEGFLDLTHRNGLATSEPLTPGEEVAVSVPLFPQDIVVPAGSTLQLTLAHTSPGPAGIAPWPTNAIVSVHHGEGTWLMLPSVGLHDVMLEARQPEDVGCWAC